MTIQFEVWAETKVEQHELLDTISVTAQDEYTAHANAWYEGGKVAQEWIKKQRVYNVYVAGTDELALEKFEQR